jgi:hypothetical protein
MPIRYKTVPQGQQTTDRGGQMENKAAMARHQLLYGWTGELPPTTYEDGDRNVNNTSKRNNRSNTSKIGSTTNNAEQVRDTAAEAKSFAT